MLYSLGSVKTCLTALILAKLLMSKNTLQGFIYVHISPCVNRVIYVRSEKLVCANAADKQAVTDKLNS